MQSLIQVQSMNQHINLAAPKGMGQMPQGALDMPQNQVY